MLRSTVAIAAAIAVGALLIEPVRQADSLGRILLLILAAVLGAIVALIIASL